MVRTVMDGRQVRLQTLVGEAVGYLAGMDDFHWMIVSPDGQVILVHKGSTPVISFDQGCAYAAEDNLDALEKIIGPFRSHVQQTYFGRAAAVSATTRAPRAPSEEFRPC